MAFRKAERRKAKLRLAITGPAGSGKTYGALLVATGLGGRIAMIDTENGSGDLYSGLIGNYDIDTITAPYEVGKYLNAIHTAERSGYDVLIIDSLSHAWSGEGGLLELKDKLAETNRNLNSYTAWGKVTPLHNKLVEAMLTSPCHIIATMRSKTEYVLTENDKGKKEPRKVGLAPVQRDGMDYEFGVVFDLSANHSVTVSKDRTSLFDGRTFALSAEVGGMLKNWLESGADISVSQNPSQALIARKTQLWHNYLGMAGNDAQKAQGIMLEITGKGSREWTEEDCDKLAQELTTRFKNSENAVAESHSPIELEEVPLSEEILEPAVNA